MKAVILVGGFATRLRPLTLNTPKAMVPVLNKPFLEHVIGQLVAGGIRDVVLALSHLAPPVEGYFGDGANFGLNINYVVEKAPLGTAGAARNALGYVQDTCLVMNGDVFTGLDLAAMKSCHDAHHAKVTIALQGVDNPCAYGLVETLDDGGVKRFLEKPLPHEITTNMINAGIYIIEPEVLAAIPPDTRVSFEKELFPSLVVGGRPVYGFVGDSYWIDIGTPYKYHQLNRDLLNGLTKPGVQPAGQNTHGTVNIGLNARLEGPVLIGDGCNFGYNVSLLGPAVLGDRCQIKNDAIVKDSILWHNVVLGAGSVIESSIIGNDCHLEPGCRLSDCVVGDHIVLPAGYCQTGGQIWPGLI